jgi:hypothetical protein
MALNYSRVPSRRSGTPTGSTGAQERRRWFSPQSASPDGIAYDGSLPAS